MPRPPLSGFDPDDMDRLDEGQEDRKLLGKLRLVSMTATPPAIHPFQQSTIAWQVTVPPDVAMLDGLTFKFGNAVVPPNGSYVVSPHATGAYMLTAQTPRASRMLGTQVVTVLLDDCQEWEIWPAQLKFYAQSLQQLFTGSTLTARGEISLSANTEYLAITIPLELAINNFYNADVDVDLRISVSAANGRAVAALVGVDVDVIFHWLEHIGSAGLATALQAVVQPVAASLIHDFLGAQIATTLADALQKVVTDLLTYWRTIDPAHREYRLYDIITWEYGIKITGCPVHVAPPGPTGGGHGGLDTGGGVIGRATRRGRGGRGRRGTER